MASTCRACSGDIEHCHGTVIVHASVGTECTEDGCLRPDVAHSFRVDCDAIGCTCATMRAIAM